MKKILNVLGVIVLSLLILFLLLSFVDFYKKNYKYSIGMPNIFTNFEIKDDIIEISGIENIVGGNIATLDISYFTCDLKNKVCFEKRVNVTNIRGVMIFPYYNEYEVKYADNSKVLFTDGKTNGEIDLIAKTITFTTYSFFDNKPRKIEIITDKHKAQELSNKIIRKYLKYNFF